MSLGDTLVEKRVGEPVAAAAPAGARGEVLAWGMGVVQRVARNMFGLDYRSLALLRIGLGACLLWVAYTNAWEMRAFYTDEGVLPRKFLLENTGGSAGFSLYFADGGMVYVGALFAVQMILAVMMVAGYWTRAATVGSYILLLSMQNRQPVLLFGADIALRVGLFWAMFLPLGRRFSVDRLTGLARAGEGTYLGVAGVAMIVQVCAIYTGGALMKVGPTWQVEHTAVANALALDVYARPLGQWIGQFSWLTAALTIVTVKLEMYGPALFILPVFSKWGRLLGVLLFAGLQISFGLCMTMGVFGAVMISLTLVFLPAMFWERVGEPAGRWVARKFRFVGAVGAMGMGAWVRNWVERARAGNVPLEQPRGVRYVRVVMGLARDGVVVMLLVVMVLWNVGNVPGQPWRLSEGMGAMASQIGLEQRWDMFAPDPQNYDGWFVVAGTMRNGETVDLMSGARPVSYEKPAWVAGSYQSMLWMSYLISFFWDDGASSPELFTKYLGRRWNESHSGAEQLESIEIDVMMETAEPGPAKGEAIREPKWVERF